jgi:hypothetical protein
MKVIYNHLIPFKGYVAINLFGIVFARKEFEGKLTNRTLRHEYIHTLQMKELWYLWFYILYLYWYIKGLFVFKSHKTSYYAIPFEQEAYYMESKPSYIDQRPNKAWKNFKY